MNDPCEKCGGNRWETVIKGMAWKCRKCDHVRGTLIEYPKEAEYV